MAGMGHYGFPVAVELQVSVLFWATLGAGS